VFRVLLILLLIFSNELNAEGVYQSQEAFISQAFKAAPPKVSTLWLTADDKTVIAEIMSHSFNLLRVRYWQSENETVWILNEIGKEKPITIGIHIKAKQIQQIKVLAFRESRGDEVKHSFFTDQFISAKLTENNKLDQHIDGITGATMSVRALTKVARVALWLDQKVQK
jgi:hypothetical protein